MISIAEEDRDVFRFLWLEDIDGELPRVQVLRFTRVVFGVSSSPFLLNATIRYHMDGYKDKDPQFVEKFQRSIYVDDITFGGDDEEVFELYEKAKSWLAEGSFNLRKFVTNSPELQQRIDEQEGNGTVQTSTGDQKTAAEDLSYAKNTLGDNHTVLSGLKVLGIQWEPTTDSLCFNIGRICDVAEKIAPTMRNIISVVSKFYDPLGVLSPFTVRFKGLFQELCVKEVGWDEPLSGELLSKWREILQSWKMTKALVLPRCYFRIGDRVTSCRLLGFSDASQLAYAAVVYLHVETTNGSLCISSLPRIEYHHCKTTVFLVWNC